MRSVAVLTCLTGILWGMPASAEELSVPADYQGRQIQLRADFEKPAGGGPFPAVIALHSCGGYRQPYSILAWRGLLQQQGYATLQLDSFTARGHYGDICGNTDEVTGVERATDALAGAYMLAGRADVRRDRIAVIGWSHGGWGAAMVAHNGPNTQPAREKLSSRGGKVVASIDLYGGCGAFSPYPVVAPLLVLVGSADTWINGGAPCVELSKVYPALVTVQIYPGVYHGFDIPGDAHNSAGHIVRYDAAATADARVRATEFLRRYMQ